GGGGSGEVNQGQYQGGTGGAGGGIVYIAANNVSNGGSINANGGAGAAASCYDASWCGGGGGGGAGGSLKIVGATLTLGANLVTTSGGGGGYGGSAGNSGGGGGVGKIAINSTYTFSGSTYPTAATAEVPSYHYSMLISDEIPTKNAVDYGKLKWIADLDNFGLISLQTRSGPTPNSTDNSWEAWKSATGSASTLTLDDANTHTAWSASTATLTVNDGDITRNVDFFEDEDESVITNTTKLIVSANNVGYAEKNIGYANLTNYDYITFWAYSSKSGDVVTMGIGESSGAEHYQTFSIDQVNVWQKIYWDISKIPNNEKDAMKFIRITPQMSASPYNLYFDNIKAEKLMSDAAGTNIMSTPNQYAQYRAILSSTRAGSAPTLYSVNLDYNDGYKVVQTDANKVRLYNSTGSVQQLKLDAIVYGADLAEWYTVDDQSIEGGDVVALTGEIDSNDIPILRKTTSANDPGIIGVISTKAGQTLVEAKLWICNYIGDRK
ncbi:MAG: hypothetical protein NTV98_03665, partial [Candidatus Roizmanbacteria bacterium]|nr:hypothetical protein [Candidatus Roizmanbacteria bacterium]